MFGAVAAWPPGNTRIGLDFLRRVVHYDAGMFRHAWYSGHAATQIRRNEG